MTAPMHLAVGGWLWSDRPDGAGVRLAELTRHAVAHLRHGERLTWLAGRGGAPDLPPTVAVEHLAISAQPLRRRAADQRSQVAAAVRQRRITHLEAPCLPLPDVRGTGCRVWTTVHDLRDLEGYRRRWPKLLRWLYRHQLRRADGILVPSEATARSLEAHRITSSAFVVPNGVRPISRARAPEKPPVFTHIGHLEPRKNLGILLEAAALLRRRGVAFRLVLAGADAGSGPDLRALSDALGIGDAVELPGIIDEAQKAHLLRTCTAVVVPSRCEGFGMVALEGLAWGAPTLVANTPALVEVVGDAGPALPPTSAAAWADAMQASIDATQGESERRARAAAFDWPTAARRWLDAFRSIPGSAPSAASPENS